MAGAHPHASSLPALPGSLARAGFMDHPFLLCQAPQQELGLTQSSWDSSQCPFEMLASQLTAIHAAPQYWFLTSFLSSVLLVAFGLKCVLHKMVPTSRCQTTINGSLSFVHFGSFLVGLVSHKRRLAPIPPTYRWKCFLCLDSGSSSWSFSWRQEGVWTRQSQGTGQRSPLHRAWLDRVLIRQALFEISLYDCKDFL